MARKCKLPTSPAQRCQHRDAHGKLLGQWCLLPNAPIGSWRQSHGQLHICSWEEDANMAGKARKNSSEVIGA